MMSHVHMCQTMFTTQLNCICSQACQACQSLASYAVFPVLIKDHGTYAVLVTLTRPTNFIDAYLCTCAAPQKIKRPFQAVIFLHDTEV